MNENLICYLLAYLIAAIPSGLLIAKFLGNVNIKNEGSKSIGATNVLRVVSKHGDGKKGKKLAILTVLCDVLKGVVPILVARICGVGDETLWAMAVLSVLGHCFSPYLKFEGGKGVATGAGVIACFMPLCIVAAIASWAFVAKVIKISALASFAGVITMLVTAFLLYPNGGSIGSYAPILIISFVIFYKHIPNIKRLLSGEESRVV